MTKENIIAMEENGSLSFGDYNLETKTKVEDFAYQGDLMKVKTFAEITKLEKNGSFLYESVPGTSVREFTESEEGISFLVSGKEDAQITVGLAEQSPYQVSIDGEVIGVMETHISGKLSIGVEFIKAEPVKVEIKRA